MLAKVMDGTATDRALNEVQNIFGLGSRNRRPQNDVGMLPVAPNAVTHVSGLYRVLLDQC